MMSWIKSGDLIIIVVLGGMGTLFGPLYGAIAFLLKGEEGPAPDFDQFLKSPATTVGRNA